MYCDVLLEWHCMPCMYPQILCNVDVMISTLQKRLQDALLSLVGPSCSFRIGSHLGRDKLVSEPRPTLGAPLIDRVVRPLLSLEENCFRSLVISESRNSFYSSAPFVALVRNLEVGVLNYSSSLSNFL